MTDKQIIIDGVDISKCKHYDEVFNYCDQSYLGEGGLLKNTKNPKRCECSPNCYYKQLKRKEQECELLKEDERYLLNVIDHLQKQKNEWEEKYNDLGQDFDQLKAENEKLKQTLTEIKEIVKPYQRNIDKTCGHCRRYDTCHACCIDDIN